MSNIPTRKFGFETTLEIDLATGAGEGIHEEFYDGNSTRRLHLSNDSIKIDDEQQIVEKVFDLYRKMKDGKILGFTLDAAKYHPQTLKVGRMVITAYKLADQ